MPGGVTGATVGERLTQPHQRRLQHRDRERDGFATEGGHASAELRREVFRRQRQAGEPGLVERRGEVRNQHEQLALQHHRRLEVRTSQPDGGPPILGRFHEILEGNAGNGDVRHGATVQYTNRVLVIMTA